MGNMGLQDTGPMVLTHHIPGDLFWTCALVAGSSGGSALQVHCSCTSRLSPKGPARCTQVEELPEAGVPPWSSGPSLVARAQAVSTSRLQSTVVPFEVILIHTVIPNKKPWQTRKAKTLKSSGRNHRNVNSSSWVIGPFEIRAMIGEGPIMQASHHECYRASRQILLSWTD